MGFKIFKPRKQLFVRLLSPENSMNLRFFSPENSAYVGRYRFSLPGSWNLWPCQISWVLYNSFFIRAHSLWFALALDEPDYFVAQNKKEIKTSDDKGLLGL